MKYFRDPESLKVFAYEEDGSQDDFIREGMIPLTQEEVFEHLNPPATKKSVEIARLQDYANPVTGSDRLFSEAVRMQMMGEPGYEDVRERAIERFKEIQAEHPWPKE